jgi:hypothetical protein
MDEDIILEIYIGPKRIPVKFHNNADGSFSRVVWTGAPDVTDLLVAELFGTSILITRYHKFDDGTYGQIVKVG